MRVVPLVSVVAGGTAVLLTVESVGRRGAPAGVPVPVLVVVADVEDGVVLEDEVEMMQEVEAPHTALF
jgi:hypothetical protein